MLERLPESLAGMIGDRQSFSFNVSFKNYKCWLLLKNLHAYINKERNKSNYLNFYLMKLDEKNQTCAKQHEAENKDK